MKYIDVTVQTLILFSGIFFSLFSLQHGEWFLVILLTPLILGPWQLLSSLLSILTGSDFQKMKRLHFMLSLTYLLILLIGFNGGIKFFRFPDFVIALLVTIPAWSLAIFYYFITWKCVLPVKRRRGSFLPNLSF